MLPSLRLHSNFGRLLPTARLTTYDPAVPQVYTASAASQTRGDFGLKRPLAAAAYAGPGRVRYIGVDELDSDAGATTWREEEQRVLLRASWLESGARLRRANGAAAPKPVLPAALFESHPTRLLPSYFSKQNAPDLSDDERWQLIQDARQGLPIVPASRTARSGGGGGAAARRAATEFGTHLDMRDDFCAMSPAAFERFLRRVRTQRSGWSKALQHDRVQRAREIAVRNYRQMLIQRRRDAEKRRADEAAKRVERQNAGGVAVKDQSTAAGGGKDVSAGGSKGVSIGGKGVSIGGQSGATINDAASSAASPAPATTPAAAVEAQQAEKLASDLTLDDIPMVDLSKLNKQPIDTWDASRVGEAEQHGNSWFDWLMRRAQRRAATPGDLRLLPRGGGADSTHKGASAAAAPLHPFGGLQYGAADAIQGALLASPLPGYVLCSSGYDQDAKTSAVSLSARDRSGYGSYERARNNGYVVSLAGRMAQMRASNISGTATRAIDWAADAQRAETQVRVVGEAIYGAAARPVRRTAAVATGANAPAAPAGLGKYALLPNELGAIYPTVLPSAPAASSNLPGSAGWVGARDGRARSQVVHDFAALSSHTTGGAGPYGRSEISRQQATERRRAAAKRVQKSGGTQGILDRLAKM